MFDIQIENLIKALNVNSELNSKNKLIFATNFGLVLGNILQKNNNKFDFENFSMIKVLFESVQDDRFIFESKNNTFIILYDVKLIQTNNNIINLPFLILFLNDIQGLSFGRFDN